MTGKADAVRAVSQQFKDRTNAVIEGVMAHLRDDNAKEILGPGLSPLIGRGPLRAIVTLALYADVLRMVRDITVKDGTISDDEIDATFDLLSALAEAFAKARNKDYATYGVLSSGNARPFLAHYENDAGLFGYQNEGTRWAGQQICCRIDEKYKDPGPISLFGAALLEWAQAIASSDSIVPSEQSHSQSLASFLNVPHHPGYAKKEASPPTPNNTARADVSPPLTDGGATTSGKPQKDCLYCGETILAVAIKCKHCGEMQAEPVVVPSRTHFSHQSSKYTSVAVGDNLAATVASSDKPSGHILTPTASSEVVYPEIKRTCNKCGTVWFSDSKREELLESLVKAGNIANLMGMASVGLAGYGRAGGLNSIDSRQRELQNTESNSDKLVSLRRCRQCNSTSFTEIKPDDSKAKAKPKPSNVGANVLLGLGSLIIAGNLLVRAGFLLQLVQLVVGCAMVWGGWKMRQAALRTSASKNA